MNRYAPDAPANFNVMNSLAFTHRLTLAQVRSLAKGHPTCAALDAACREFAASLAA